MIQRPTVVLFLAALLATRIAAQGADAEKATHGADAARAEMTFEKRFGDTTLRQYRLGCLSLLSYLVVDGKDAAVIDPQRDVAVYLADAAKMGATIKFVLLSHHHADFVAGHTELMQAGAEVLVAAEALAEYKHRPMKDGESVVLGNARFEFWSTPGHTPDASTILFAVGSDVVAAFTGDTLFIGGVGRPDLLDRPAAELAAQGFDSIQRLKKLPDATLVLPAHGAGSLCGAHLSSETTSTMAREKSTNPYLAPLSKTAFVAMLLSSSPVAPGYFSANVAMNRKGPPVVARSAAMPKAIDAPTFAKAADSGAWIVDLRDQKDYAVAHVRGAINISLRGRLDTWTGSVVPFGAPFYLVGSDDEVREGAFRLRRIGYDEPAGYLEGGMTAFAAANLPTAATTLVAPAELQKMIAEKKEPVIVDVRTRDEYLEARIGEIAHLPLTEFDRLKRLFDPEAPILFACNSAYRSSMAAGLAERAGFKSILGLDGGLDAWLSAGLPGVGSALAATRPAAPTKISAMIPEPIAPESLASVLLEQPSNYAVIDIRPAFAFAEYKIPGAVNVAVDQLAAHIASVPAAKTIVIVDRAGDSAIAVAATLMASGAIERGRVRVLSGGTLGYWNTVELRGKSGGRSMPAPVPAKDDAAPIPAAPKRRNVGC